MGSYVVLDSTDFYCLDKKVSFKIYYFVFQIREKVVQVWSNIFSMLITKYVINIGAVVA